MKRYILLAAALSLLACTAPDMSTETLHKAGFTQITTGGYAFFTCGDDYTFSTKFSAKNPNKEWVDGAVCCGILKGCTIKF